MKSVLGTCVILMNFGIIISNNDLMPAKNLKLYTITIASHNADGLDRLRRSASVYGINLQVLIEPEWMHLVQNIEFARRKIEELKNDSNAVVLRVDAFDVMFNAGEDEILNKFLEFKADIVFGAEMNYICNEDKKKLHDQISKGHKLKYLNSGTTIGYASQLYKLYSIDPGDETIDQCSITNTFLDPDLRKELKLKLDYNQRLFQTLTRIEDGLEIEFFLSDGRLVNTYFNTRPAVIHGNGYSGKNTLRKYGNYIAKSWTPSKGCMICTEGRIDLNSTSKLDYPKVLLGVFVKEKTPFLEDMLQKVVQQVYPKEKIFLYVNNNVPDHEKVINEWILSMDSKYPFVEYTSSFDNVSHGEAKHLAMNLCSQSSCDVFFNVESEVHLDNPNTLSLLISYNRTIIAPIITRNDSLYSNFWGDQKKMYYKRSFDYVDIVTGIRRGIWNVPYIYGAYVMWRHVFENPKRVISYTDDEEDADMSFCLYNAPYSDPNFFYAVNLEYYGHLMNMEFENPEGPPDDILLAETLPKDWKSRYIHPDYYKVLNNTSLAKQLCSDVFSFPVFAKPFAKDIFHLLLFPDLKATMDTENNIDIPEREDKDKSIIKLSSLGFENHWRHIVKKYIAPLVKSLFTGYNGKGNPSSSFIRVWKPMNQSVLPHLDPSRYTVVTTLSSPGIDFLGGGIKFFKSGRRECVALPAESGWVTVYPGKPTHYHQELRVKAGFKYDLVYYAD